MKNYLKKCKNRRKINLLFVTRGLFIGGAELVLSNLCRELPHDRYNISICYLKLDGPVGKQLAADGFEVFRIPKSVITCIDYFSFLTLAKIVKEKCIDIIHSHDTPSLTEASFCRAVLLFRVKMVHTFHFGNYPYLRKNDMLFERISWRIPNQLVAVGKQQKTKIQKTYGIPDNKILTIRNGIHVTKANIDPVYFDRFQNNKNIVIGTLSTLIEQKGLTYLLDVAALLKKRNFNFVFLLVGGGPLRETLELKSRSLGLQDFVFFLGWVEDAASRVLPIFDIFFQPSLWEAMSMVLLEAMAAGKPVVASNVGENKYIIDHGENGFLVEPKNIREMAMALEKLINQPQLRKKFGLSAQQKINQYFSTETMASNYEKLYQQLVAGQSYDIDDDIPQK